MVLPPEAILKSVLVWVAILVLAVLNGVLRESFLLPAVGARAALSASGILLALCIAGVACAAAPWFGRLSGTAYWAIGTLWLSLTLGFEFAFGYLYQNKPWRVLLEAYTFEGGNIWPVVLAVTFMSPWLGARIRGLIREVPGVR
jgi:hypothetical protein